MSKIEACLSKMTGYVYIQFVLVSFPLQRICISLKLPWRAISLGKVFPKNPAGALLYKK